MIEFSLPEPCLVVLVGPSGAGKSTWAATHWARNEIVSTDALRAVVGTGRADLDATTTPSRSPDSSSRPGSNAV